MDDDDGCHFVRDWLFLLFCRQAAPPIDGFRDFDVLIDDPQDENKLMVVFSCSWPDLSPKDSGSRRINHFCIASGFGSCEM